MNLSGIPKDRITNQGLNTGATVRSLLVSLAINTIPSFLVFEVCTLVIHSSDMMALLISSIPVIVYVLVEIARRRRFDFMSGFMMLVIAIGISIMLVSRNPRLYLLRESFIPTVIGVVYMVSLLFPKPLWFYVGRYFMAGNDTENAARFDDRWRYPFFRFAMRLMTLVWGSLTLLVAGVHIAVVLFLPLPLVLLTGPILNTGFWIVLLLWTGWYLRRLSKNLRVISKPSIATSEGMSGVSA